MQHLQRLPELPNSAASVCLVRRSAVLQPTSVNSWEASSLLASQLKSTGVSESFPVCSSTHAMAQTSPEIADGDQQQLSKLDGKPPESTDFANYFCTYAYLYHQVRITHASNRSHCITLPGDCACHLQQPLGAVRPHQASGCWLLAAGRIASRYVLVGICVVAA